MPIDPNIRDRAYQMFVQEAPEWLQAIEMELVAIQDGRCSTGQVHQLLRAAHSLKGSASTVGLESIKNLAHQMEDIFRVLGHPDLEIDPELERLLLKACDYLEALIASEIEGKSLPENISSSGEIALTRIDDRIGHFTIVGQNSHHQDHPEWDLVAAIFEIDVTKALQQLEAVLLNTDRTPAETALLVGTFRAQAEVFRGMSEMCQLPGFGSIANQTIAALDLHPERGPEVCCFALIDFQAAAQAVIKGDRAIGGTTSYGLQLLATSPVETSDDTGMVDDDFGLPEPDLEWRSRRENSEEFDLLLDIDRDLELDLEDRSEDLPFFAMLFDRLSFDLVDLFEFSDSRSNLARSTGHLGIPDLERTVAELTAEFSRLALKDDRQIAISTALKLAQLRPKKSRTAKKSIPAGSQLSVRVGLDRLDRMNNLVGELTIDRNGLDLNRDRLAIALQELRSKLEGFQHIGAQMGLVADRLSVSLPHLRDDLADSQFDSLELDRYTEIHALVQHSIEQIAQIEENVEDLAYIATQSGNAIDRQRKMLSHLRDDLMWARMLPIGEILNRFPRTIHDLSVKFDKPVDLKITGSGVLVDKLAIEKLLDPLVHLVRNAFDHGIESKAERAMSAKPERGNISINAYHQGSQTVVQIKDDGRGLNLEKIVAKGLSLGLISPTEAQSSAPEVLWNLIFHPGFSTATQVTELSGRGMGLDIVKAQLESIKGKILVESRLGQGTTFTLTIPLTLTIANLLIAQVGMDTYAFPSDRIQRILVPHPDWLTTQDGEYYLRWENERIPIHRLKDWICYQTLQPSQGIDRFFATNVSYPSDWAAPLLIVRDGQTKIALEIDRLLTEQELAIESFGKAMTPPSYLCGCSILSDGSIVPVIDPQALMRSAINQAHHRFDRPQLPTAVNQAKLILVVDDSLTARQSLCLSLEKAGYQTLQARDGKEALDLLQQNAAAIKLVISDVEMPNMNGFEFLNLRRQNHAIAKIPVFMLTSRANPKHRQYAQHLGATDYFTKPYLENNFLVAVDRILQ
jgi:two-component system, chemotaxis family, sensor histidine kinase and response regulator PixL